MAIDKSEENKDQYVLAFDPGGTTGMALLRYNDNEVVLSLLGQIEDAHMGFYDNLVGVPGGFGTPTSIVSEQWVEHGIKGVDRTPLVIEGIQYAFWPDQVAYQTPDMKQMVPDDLLKEIGAWTEGKPHQMDALRHALIWLRNQKHQPTLECLANGTPLPQDGDQEGPKQFVAGMNDGTEGDEGQDGEGQGEVGDGEALRGALGVLQEEPDDISGLQEQVRLVYERERDLDGAFAGYQADAGESRTMLIDQDF